jgi:hypothetical protein
VGIRGPDHATPLYPEKLALNSPTSGGRSVGIATELIYRQGSCLIFHLGIIAFYKKVNDGAKFCNGKRKNRKG